VPCVPHVLRVTRASRVAFARGPLPTADGHPPHEGQQMARKVREVANDWGRSLTPEHVRALQQELGPENAASVDRLKRRSVPPLPAHPASRLKVSCFVRPVSSLLGACPR
jgi:hypothetical protein